MTSAIGKGDTHGTEFLICTIIGIPVADEVVPSHQTLTLSLLNFYCFCIRVALAISALNLFTFKKQSKVKMIHCNISGP